MYILNPLFCMWTTQEEEYKFKGLYISLCGQVYMILMP